MLTELLIKYVFRQEPEFCIFLGKVTQKGSTLAIFSSTKVWQRETLKTKLGSILRLRWNPSEYLLQLAAKETLMESIYGKENDYNEGLFMINAWHNSQQWDLNNLTESDLKKAEGLDAVTILIRTRHRDITSNYLHLNIAAKAPAMCILLHAMVVKIPATSILYYLDIHSAFAFNEIRKSNCQNAEDLISYIYDLQYIQQKIALSLHELICLIDNSEKNKSDSLLINSELSAIGEVEYVFANLKATIEKIMVVIGLTYGIKNLESKKTHKSKLDALENGIPDRVKTLFYYEFIFEHIKSENLDTLNNYRTGILHKKGISDLQPHNYVGQNANDVPLKKMFDVLIEQHSKNTVILIGTYALLTDELVNIDPPSIRPEELPY